MEKARVVGVSKSDRHNYFCFEKTQGFLGFLRGLLGSLGFDPKEYFGFGRPQDKSTGEPAENEEISVSRLTDHHFYFQNEEFIIDVIVGKNRIFLVISSHVDKQGAISEKINELATSSDLKPPRRAGRTDVYHVSPARR